MAMVGWVVAGMEAVGDMNTRQSQGVWSHVGRCRSTSRVRHYTLMTPDHTVIKVRCFCVWHYTRCHIIYMAEKGNNISERIRSIH